MDLNNCNNNANDAAAANEAAQQFPPAAETASTAENSQAAASAGRAENCVLVSMNNIPAFYARIGRKMMMGHGDEKPGMNEVVFSGLGMATKTAIGAASLLETENAARMTLVQTSYFASVRGPSKMVPKITIVCTRTPEFVEQIAREKAAAAENERAAANAAAADSGSAAGAAASLGGAPGVTAGGLVTDAVAAA